MIKIENLTAGYYKEKNILKIDLLEFADGKINSIIGLNGSGKSTLLKTIIGLTNYSGNIFVDEKNLSSLSHKERAKKIAYLSQNYSSVNMDVYTLVCHGRFPYLGFSKVLSQQDKDLVEYSLSITDLWQKRFYSVKEISGGEKQRAYIAMAIAQNTKMLLLDEVCSSIDIKHQIKIMKILHKLSEDGKGIILTSHNLEQSFSDSDIITLLDKGKLVSSKSPQEFLKDKDFIKNIFKVSLKQTQEENSLYKYILLS